MHILLDEPVHGATAARSKRAWRQLPAMVRSGRRLAHVQLRRRPHKWVADDARLRRSRPAAGVSERRAVDHVLDAHVPRRGRHLAHLEVAIGGALVHAFVSVPRLAIWWGTVSADGRKNVTAGAPPQRLTRAGSAEQLPAGGGSIVLLGVAAVALRA